MKSSQVSAGTAETAASKAVQLGMAALLGVIVIGVSGFSHMEVVHNAGHDYRHSMAFPCH